MERDAILDDFINSIYELERKLRRKVVTDMATIDEELNPQVYARFRSNPSKDGLLTRNRGGAKSSHYNQLALSLDLRALNETIERQCR